MGSEKREDIGPQWNSQEANKLNNMLMWIWKKIHGDINFVDVNPNVKAQMFTYPLQPQGEGNLDAAHPFYVRFYVPAEVKKVKTASLNAMVSRYRMDSAVTESADIPITDMSATGGPSSITSSDVEYWGDGGGFAWQNPATQSMNKDSIFSYVSGSNKSYQASDFYKSAYDNEKLSGRVNLTFEDIFHPLDDSHNSLYGFMEWFKQNIVTFVDYYDFNHKHNIEHTHEVGISIVIGGHSHDLAEGIIESSVQPADVKIYVNDNLVGNAMSESNAAQNNIDILQYVVPGQWNIIKITASNLARITIYGIIELIQQYTNN